jgi:hypothetical protein
MASPWSFGRSALASGESSRRELEGLNHTNGHNAGTRLDDLLAQHAKGLGAVPPARRILFGLGGASPTNWAALYGSLGPKRCFVKVKTI